jgi:hypothetical protein
VGLRAGVPLLTFEAEIARLLYEELRGKALRSKSVRLPIGLEEYQRRWPTASRDEIIRACLIAYEMLIQDVAESIATASGKRTALPDFKGKIDDEGGDT